MFPSLHGPYIEVEVRFEGEMRMPFCEHGLGDLKGSGHLNVSGLPFENFESAQATVDFISSCGDKDEIPLEYIVTAKLVFKDAQGNNAKFSLGSTSLNIPEVEITVSQKLKGRSSGVNVFMREIKITALPFGNDKATLYVKISKEVGGNDDAGAAWVAGINLQSMVRRCRLTSG